MPFYERPITCAGRDNFHRRGNSEQRKAKQPQELDKVSFDKTRINLTRITSLESPL